MTDDDTAARVREAARRYGIDASAADVYDLVPTVRALEERFEAIDGSVPDSTPAADVRRGDDAFNAFVHRCRLGTRSGGGSGGVGHGKGPLSDFTVAVKDNLAVAGVPMTCGSEALSHTPSHSATVVCRLVDAGAILVGTTNMDSFAYFVTGETSAHGPTLNPRVEGAVPGGSSSGSGAAVAGGLVDIALGSDTGGSIRIPASYCGVVGIKPTVSAVSRQGFADLAPSLDHVGPLARTVEDAALALAAIHGPDPRDLTTYGTPPLTDLASAADAGVEGLRLAVLEEGLAVADTGVADRVEIAAAGLEAAGATVERVSVPAFDRAREVLVPIVGHEFSRLLKNYGHVFGAGPSYDEAWRRSVRDLVDRGAFEASVADQVLAADAVTRASEGRLYVAAQSARADVTEALQSALAGFDAFVLPTTPTTAPEFGDMTDLDDLIAVHAATSPFSLSGHPVVSVPCGDVDGAPVGLQAVADWHGESTVLRVAGAVERRR